MNRTSLTPRPFTLEKLTSNSTVAICKEFIAEREPCTMEEIIEAFWYTRRIDHIKNILAWLERSKKIKFNPRTKTFSIWRKEE